MFLIHIILLLTVIIAVFTFTIIYIYFNIKEENKIPPIYKFKDIPHLIKDLENEKNQLPNTNKNKEKIKCLKSLKKHCEEQKISECESKNCKVIEEINERIKKYEEIK